MLTAGKTRKEITEIAGSAFSMPRLMSLHRQFGADTPLGAQTLPARRASTQPRMRSSCTHWLPTQPRTKTATRASGASM